MKTALLILMSGVLLLSGCSGDDAGGSDAVKGPALRKMPVSGSTLMIGGPIKEIDDEVLKGKPVFINGCLGATNGEKNYLVVWPDGTHIAGADSDAIEFPGGDVLEPDDTFVGKGTMVSGDPMPVQFPQIPLKCIGPNEEKIMWVQEITEITSPGD